MAPTVKRFSPSGSALTSFNAYSPALRSGVRVALGDINGDGRQEIITGAGPGGGPEVRVYSPEGRLLYRFFAYAKSFRGGVVVNAYDLDGDGQAEIITGPSAGGGPDIKIFRGDGTYLRHFFAFDQKFRGGVSVVASAFGKNGEPLIAVSSGYGSGHVRLFNPRGEFTGISFFPLGKIQYGLSISALPVDNGRSKLLVTPERSQSGRVSIFNLSNTGAPERTFLALPASFRGGIRMAGSDLDHDGESEIIVSAWNGGGPQVRIFKSNGQAVRSFFAYAKSFRGGVNVAAGDGRIVTGPDAVGRDGRSDLPKYIEVDLSDQTLKYFQNGRLIGTHKVSTGKWTTPTPIGTFTIRNKITVAYSRPYDLYMEWWMAFSADGSYGLHALPYWKTAGGGKYYEGTGHLGTPVSHGCIRQSLTEAARLFRWAEIGTTVIITR